ncbi:MAG: GerMN domain-containing protein [Selenomonadaceae bacterium]|nr:GerMN domain-containing protein [Selenomonadaceae bacterium]
MNKFLTTIMLAMLILTAGCDKPPAENQNTPKPETSSTKPVSLPDAKPDSPKSAADENSAKPPKVEPQVKAEVQENKSLNVKVYYPDDSGLRLIAVDRKITIKENTDKYLAALDILRQDPTEENLTRIVPSNAIIHSLKVSDGTATVDLDGSIAKGFVGGSTGEEFLIGSIVDTLTDFPEVQRVKFLVDGKEIETLSGHMDLSVPIERMTNLLE